MVFLANGLCNGVLGDEQACERNLIALLLADIWHTQVTARHHLSRLNSLKTLLDKKSYFSQRAIAVSTIVQTLIVYYSLRRG